MQAIRKTPSLPNYLNENQVSERLGVSVKLLHKHRRECKGLPFVKFGARVLYAEPEVVKYLQEHRIEKGKALFWSGLPFKGKVRWW